MRFTAAQATFLSAEERTWLQERNGRLAAAAIEAGSQQAVTEAVADPRTWHLAAISLLANIPKYTPCVSQPKCSTITMVLSCINSVKAAASLVLSF